MNTFPERPSPVNPDDAERAAWARDARRAQDFGTLLAWAQSTLPSDALPCRCVDASCLRCETARVVAEWEAADPPSPAASAPVPDWVSADEPLIDLCDDDTPF
jgi:hypothetical protein